MSSSRNVALNILHRRRLPTTTTYIRLLNCAALDFFLYHPITGLCSDCPVELKDSIAQRNERLTKQSPYIPIPKGRDFTAFSINIVA